MQPYFFPYLGYFQLIHVADVFVVYDDVAYIKQGWINRNFLLAGCSPQRFTVPLSGASSFRPIRDIRVANNRWKSKFLKSLEHAYRKAPQFPGVYPLAEAVVQNGSWSLAELALDSVKAVMRYLELRTTIRPTSRVYDNGKLTGQQRILDICRQEGADTYVNLPGGKPLYDREMFAASGVDLQFIRMGDVSYRQFECKFVPNLSVLDVLMFNGQEKVLELLQCHLMEH
jgi:hypothetical protein